MMPNTKHGLTQIQRRKVEEFLQPEPVSIRYRGEVRTEFSVFSAV
jgi:hypothetical protein